MRVGRALIVTESPGNPNKGAELTHWSLGLFHEFPGSVCTGHMSMDLSRCEDFPGTSLGRDSLFTEDSILVPCIYHRLHLCQAQVLGSGDAVVSQT